MVDFLLVLDLASLWNLVSTWIQHDQFSPSITDFGPVACLM